MTEDTALARIEALEAETIVLRRYLRAVISLLPETDAVSLVFAATHSQISNDAIAAHDGNGDALRKANSAFGALLIEKIGFTSNAR